MQKFEWMESLSVGVPMIDAQHKELIAAFNDLSDAIEQGNGGDSVKKLLNFLQYSIKWHFDHEENYAAQYGCVIAQKSQHAYAQLLQLLKVLQAEYRQSGASDEIARNAHAQMADWLVSYILTTDSQMYQCVYEASTPVVML